MLIAFSGLPGVGKTTLARKLAHHLSAMHIRIDTLEQAVIAAGVAPVAVGPMGYCIGYAVAEDNLSLGATVIADCVNPLAVTRDAWQAVAQRAGAPLLEVEVICSDKAEHRWRVEAREADIPGHKLPTWQDVLEREYESWEREPLVIDTATLSDLEAVDEILIRLSASSLNVP